MITHEMHCKIYMNPNAIQKMTGVIADETMVLDDALLKAIDSQNHSKEDIELIKAALMAPCRNGLSSPLVSQRRSDMWCLVLLGSKVCDIRSHCHRLNEYDQDSHELISKEDRRVLAADLRRTRQSYPAFKTDVVQNLVLQILQNYCIRRGTGYKQGLNELLAPLIALQDPPLPAAPLGFMFESLIEVFASRWYCDMDGELVALQRAFRLFRILLLYADPILALKLDECEMPPELYATPWLLTLFSRNLELNLVNRVWDFLLGIGDPAFISCLLAALLIQNRKMLLEVNHAHQMPEAIQALAVKSLNDVEELLAMAKDIHSRVPELFLCKLRQCIHESPSQNNNSLPAIPLLCESVNCACITVQELLLELKMGNRRELEVTKGRCVPMIVVDLRPIKEAEISGAGILPTGMRLDPQILRDKALIEAWIKDFKVHRGSRICLIDTAPKAIQPLKKKLWQRLLLGESDEDDISNSPDASEARLQLLARESSYINSTYLASLLHHNDFPNLMILEGGFDTLPTELLATQNSEAAIMEPILLEFDYVLFQRWRKCGDLGGESQSVSPERGGRVRANTDFGTANQALESFEGAAWKAREVCRGVHKSDSRGRTMKANPLRSNLQTTLGRSRSRTRTDSPTPQKSPDQHSLTHPSVQTYSPERSPCRGSFTLPAHSPLFTRVSSEPLHPSFLKKAGGLWQRGATNSTAAASLVLEKAGAFLLNADKWVEDMVAGEKREERESSSTSTNENSACLSDVYNDLAI